MVIATITALSILLLGGGSFSFEKYYKDFVKNVIEDKSRREQILDLAKKADEKQEQYNKEVRKVWAEDVKSAFRNFDTTEEDYRKVISKANQSRIAMQQGVLDVRFEVVKLMTEEEWNAMYDQVRKKEAEEKAKKEK
jgi:hypothetical protein